MNPLRIKTSKLFYNKWPYKILCIVNGSWKIKRLGVEETKKYCLDKERDKFDSYLPARSRVDKVSLLYFTNSVEQFLNKDIQIRVEGNLFNIYCKDLSLYNDMVKTLYTWVREVHEPANDQELEYLITSNSKKIVCNQLPYEKYRYRLYIKPATSANIKTAFAKWIENYGGKARMPIGTKQFLNNKWTTAPFIYIEDQPTLSMVGLFLGDNVQKVQEFIPRSSINISLDQEITCQP